MRLKLHKVVPSLLVNAEPSKLGSVVSVNQMMFLHFAIEVGVVRSSEV